MATWVTGALVAALLVNVAKSSPPGPSTTRPEGQQLYHGKVVFVRDALKRRGIESREELDKQVALETPEGELIPILPDWRGRAFFQDDRLRNRVVELVGTKRKGVPYLQVLMLFTFDANGVRQYTDYFCDTCGFPMYEIKACECCQGPLRLRFQPRNLPDYLKADAPKAGSADPSPSISARPAGKPSR